MILICISSLAVLLDTIPAVATQSDGVLKLIEVVAIVVFTAESLLRIWSCMAKPKYSHPVWGAAEIYDDPAAAHHFWLFSLSTCR